MWSTIKVTGVVVFWPSREEDIRGGPFVTVADATAFLASYLDREDVGGVQEVSIIKFHSPMEE